ncbi:MAG: gamma-glutamylcyclotransferase family protein [Candidatus Promineifilaceae bacterium]
MNYIAYGSNMSTAYIRDYCPSATFIMRIFLPNYRLEFRRFSTDLQGGISSIIEAPGEMVHGVLYDIDSAEIETLDILENVPEGLYLRETFLILGEDGNWHKGDLYRVANPTGPYTPAKQYIDWIISGAQEHQLDADYIAKLVALRQSLD